MYFSGEAPWNLRTQPMWRAPLSSWVAKYRPSAPGLRGRKTRLSSFSRPACLSFSPPASHGRAKQFPVRPLLWVGCSPLTPQLMASCASTNWVRAFGRSLDAAVLTRHSQFDGDNGGDLRGLHCKLGHAV